MQLHMQIEDLDTKMEGISEHYQHRHSGAWDVNIDEEVCDHKYIETDDYKVIVADWKGDFWSDEGIFPNQTFHYISVYSQPKTGGKVIAQEKVYQTAMEIEDTFTLYAVRAAGNTVSIDFSDGKKSTIDVVLGSA